MGLRVGRRERMARSVEIRFDCRSALFLSSVLLLSALTLGAQAPPDSNTPPPKTESTVPPSSSPASPGSDAKASNASEVSSHDTPATFKVRVNLVLVRVVVRDATGNVVPNLKKEDFQLFDNRKPQTISSFSVDTPESHAVVPNAPKSSEESLGEAEAINPAVLPQRFVGLVFDDTDMQLQDTMLVRDAASRLFSALAPSDRVAFYSTSGQVTQEFTSDREVLKQALLGVQPRPLARGPGIHQCPDIEYYQADQIVNYHNDQALGAAALDAIQCAFNGDQTKIAQALPLARSVAETVVDTGEAQTEFIYRHLEDAMRRLAAMPGQRVMVFVSPGFLLTQRTQESGDLIDRANRSNIVINTIDARGLYTPDVLGDIGDPPVGSFQTTGLKSSYRVEAQAAQSEILGALADGTGGTVFRNRNDIDQGLRQAVAAPAVSYLLAFSPQNLKVDGRYHTLKVSLAGKQKYLVQARHGYYAPRTIKDPAEAAKEEIREAIFSQEEIHDLPVDLQTQYFKADQTQARLAVLTHVDIKGVHFRKLDGRNRDDLTIATAIFDENGNFVVGGEKIVEMRLLEPTLDRLNTSGFTVKSSFDVKPGTYLVRLVVRDAEGAQMAARNGAVVIPY